MQNEIDIRELVVSICNSAQQVARKMALISTDNKNIALKLMAAAIRGNQTSILEANKNDINLAKQNKFSASLLDRLRLNTERINAMAKGLDEIAELPDPVGTILADIKRPNQLNILRVRVPLGVIGVIYESRPNVTADAAGLCLKSGNAVILRGGSEGFYSSNAIMVALHEGLKKAGLPLNAVQMLPIIDRKAVDELLKMDKYVDVIIPRGGMKLIKQISANSRIPLFKHLAGLCHTYIHLSANKQMARKIVLNAKMRRTSICGATEVVLVDQAIYMSYLPPIIDDLVRAGCEIRGDQTIVNLDSRVKLCTAQDYDTEFLDAIIAIKIVRDISEAIEHIAQHGTQHTEAIIADDPNAATKFLNEVDSAIVMHNTSTQFADGGEFGMGAEIGISTGKLHARGPVGVEQLTTFKYLVRGNGQIRI